MYLDVGESGDDLLLRGQIGALLEFEITNGTREGEVAIDTAKVDETTGGADTSLLAYCGGLAEALTMFENQVPTNLHSGACGQMRGAWHVPSHPKLNVNHQRWPK